MVAPDAFVERLAQVRIGSTFNQYGEGPRAPLLRDRLRSYLGVHVDADFLLVGEAPGYRGARVSGIPFTSERQLTGSGPAEASATVIHRVLEELGLEERTLLWNVVPTQIALGLTFLRVLASDRTVIAVGRVAERALGIRGVRHPSHGGGQAFRDGLVELLDARRRSPA